MAQGPVIQSSKSEKHDPLAVERRHSWLSAVPLAPIYRTLSKMSYVHESQPIALLESDISVVEYHVVLLNLPAS